MGNYLRVCHSERRLRAQRAARGIWVFRRAAALLTIAIVALAVLTLSGCEADAKARYKEAVQFTGGDPHVGIDKIRYYGCASCHTIPGIRDPQGLVGPPLTAVGDRSFIAGHVQNTPQNLEHWIMHPHSLEPHTAMPEMGVSEQDSKDIAAYLYTLRAR